MEQIAADTGGEAIFNSNDLGVAVSRAAQHGAHYYTLAYTPANKKLDGQFRRIDIKVNIKANEGRYRLAYRRGADAAEKAEAFGSKATSLREPGKEVGKTETNPLHGLMARGMPSATQILFGVRVLPLAVQPGTGAKR